MAAYGLDSASALNRVRILGLKAWNYTNGTNSSNFIRMTSAIATTTSNVVAAAEDIGNGANLPGCSINIPDLLSAEYSANSTTTSSVATLLGYGFTPAALLAQNFVVDVNLAVQPA